tara:strand:+ start:399 stop:815 length:417 start_codon:yes stop_codon:yes gene_type:complete
MNSIKGAHSDWDSFLKEKNLTHADVAHYMNNVLDTPEFDARAGKVICVENSTYCVKDSLIHGQGVFAKKNIRATEIIGTVMGGDKETKYRTCLGRFTNHSNSKNTIFKEVEENKVVAQCIKDIKKGEEILVDYRDHSF